MRETNFLIENNARHVWHAMAHPAEMLASPPKIIQAAKGVEISDIHGKTVLDAVGGNDKYVLVEMSNQCQSPFSGGAGPNYGVVSPPSLFK